MIPFRLHNGADKIGHTTPGPDLGSQLISEPAPLGPRRLDGVRIDEVLPHQAGASHEIALNRGSIYVVRSDLIASWE